ncbi:hypothetical protein L3081_20285 [Colwellia sp. MSW7]|uniref:Uncharacterized protein n=1 Tax=Colwellia maritima TaxID=2912588 RepID=A0ABS9X4X7_9GAMM|nr:hypothetical protein [Colwellia maritima]MCI2285290.1 hypothetical protein [Colwellia maritima]
MAQLHPNCRYMFKHAMKAIEILITYPCGIVERLKHSGEELLLIPIEVLPEDLQCPYLEIKIYLTKYKAKPEARFPYDTDLRETMRRRRAQTAAPMAQKVWSFYKQYENSLK